jgi:hypothetical protein
MSKGKGKPTAALARFSPSSAPTTVDKSRSIKVSLKPGESEDRAVASLVARGLVTNASTVIRFASHEHEGLSLMDMTVELRAQGEAVNGGDLLALEQTLTAQALSLNAIFGELARIAHCNLFTVPDVAERYLRLALKAQSQSRATVETLGALKNPPVVFARQANINNGGQQQVNNGVSTSAPVPRTRETKTAKSKLLEAQDVKRMDTGAQGATGGANPSMEAVGAVHRPANRCR